MRERWRFSALEHFVPDGRTNRVTSWAPWRSQKSTFYWRPLFSPQPECFLPDLHHCLSCQPLRCQPRHRARNCPIISFCETEKPAPAPAPEKPSVSPLIWGIFGVLLALCFGFLSVFCTVKYFRCLSNKIEQDEVFWAPTVQWSNVRETFKTWDWPETDLRE